MKENATDKSQKKQHPMIYLLLIWTSFATVNQNHKINLPFI